MEQNGEELVKRKMRRREEKRMGKERDKDVHIAFSTRLSRDLKKASTFSNEYKIPLCAVISFKFVLCVGSYCCYLLVIT